MTVSRSVYALRTSLTPPPVDVYGLAGNTWVHVALQASQRYIPRLMMPATVLENQPDPVSREYGGLHYGAGKIYSFGGGHGGYAGNDVETYDVTNKIWTQSYNPDVCDASDTSCNMIYQGGYAAVTAPSGRPYTEHTFQKLSWNPSTNLLWSILGAGTFTYNPITTIWTVIAAKLVGTDIVHSNLLAYDPDINTILGILTSENSVGQTPGVYQLISGAWTRVTSVPSNNGTYDVYMPDLHKHFTMFTSSAGITWWQFDAVALTWTAAAAPPAVVDSFDYDTKNHRIIGVQHQDTGVLLFSYDPVADTWTTMTNSTPRPAQPALGPHAENPIFRYDPINNVFIFLVSTGGSAGSGGTTETWAYRYI